MEKWDLYDINRNKLEGTVERGKSIPNGCFHIVVHLAIFNSKGELLAQQRSSNKETFADYWDISVGGSALLGEDSVAGMIREAKEELGFMHEFKKEEVAFTIIDPFSIKALDDYYVIKEDVDLVKLVLQKEEVQAVKYMSYEEVKKAITDGDFIPYYFIEDIFEANKKTV